VVDGQQSRGELEGPAGDLLAVATATVPIWLSRCVEQVAAAQSIPVDDVAVEIEAMVERTATETLARLAALLGTDVDEQRANPLDILRDARSAVRPPCCAPQGPSPWLGTASRRSGFPTMSSTSPRPLGLISTSRSPNPA
jgi:hypothetical protein